MSQELVITVRGGYNGGAVINMTLDNTQVFTSTAPDTYNQNYNNRSGSFQTQAGEVSVTIIPPPTSTSALTIMLSGAVTDSLSIMPAGQNTSYGYNYSTSYEIGGEPPLPPDFFDTGLGWGAMGNWLSSSGPVKIGSLGHFEWPNTDYVLPIPRTAPGAADVYASGTLVFRYHNTNNGYDYSIYAGATTINGFCYYGVLGGAPFIGFVSPDVDAELHTAVYNETLQEIAAGNYLIANDSAGKYNGVTWYYDSNGIVYRNVDSGYTMYLYMRFCEMEGHSKNLLDTDHYFQR